MICNACVHPSMPTQGSATFNGRPSFGMSGSFVRQAVPSGTLFMDCRPTPRRRRQPEAAKLLNGCAGTSADGCCKPAHTYKSSDVARPLPTPRRLEPCKETSSSAHEHAHIRTYVLLLAGAGVAGVLKGRSGLSDQRPERPASSNNGATHVRS